MNYFYPDIYQKSIYSINYGKLLENGIRCLLFDLDNTCVPYIENKPDKKLKDHFDKLKDMGFKVIIFSNSHKKRLEPFKKELNVDCSPNCKKPLRGKFIKIMDIYDYKLSEVAIIGDQLVTDIYGGNKVGITTILVNPIGKDPIWTKFNRIREKNIMQKLRDNNLFTKGKYYE